MIQIGRSNSGMHPHAAPATAARGQHSEGYCSDMDVVPSFYDPTPETEPAAIAADQRAALLELLPPVVIDPAAMSVAVVPLSAAVVLPASVVARRLRELGYAARRVAPAGPPPGRGPARERLCWKDVLDVIRGHLRAHGPLPTTRLAELAGADPTHVGRNMGQAVSRFYVLRHERSVAVGRGRDVQVWWLVGEPVPAAGQARRTG